MIDTKEAMEIVLLVIREETTEEQLSEEECERLAAIIVTKLQESGV